MHNHIFVWAQEFMRSRTKYCLGFYEISYEILFGILRDFVQDIVWDFARSRTNFRMLNTMDEVS